jgi:hypothetical protein
LLCPPSFPDAQKLTALPQELESLLEKGIITDAAFDSISDLLPAETPLSGAAGARINKNPPTPARSTAASPAPLSSNNPPSYAHSQSTAAPPSLPIRNNNNTTTTTVTPAPAPPPPAAPVAPPSRPVLARARALYRYAAGDARDVSFERDDEIAVFEYMNADWWMGRNERTGGEGIFPRSYVVVLSEGGAGEKAGGGVGGYPAQPVYAGQLAAPTPVGAGGGGGYPVSPVPVAGGGYPAPPPPGQAAVPYQQGQPEQQQGGESKFGEQGKKFGKKLGNAAIFGAGATIGSNIVNSIF